MARASARKRNRPPVRGRSAEARKARKAAGNGKPFPWKALATWLGVGVLVIGVAAFLVTQRNSTSENPRVTALAEQNAGGAIEVHTGSAHTVYHSVAPLPTASAPRIDGKPTLVWFSGTWCEFCEVMEPWAHDVAARFTDRLVFVEKSVDHDRGAAQRYRVLGTPAFVLVDENGTEISRFGFLRSAESFSSTIEQSLVTGGF